MVSPRLLSTGFLSQSSDAYNIKLPWTPSEQDGLFAMNYRPEDAVLDNLAAWAKTNWGERPNRFRFGLDAKRYLFEPATIAKSNIENNAREQIPLYFPFLKIVEMSVEITETSQGNGVRFLLEASFRDDQQKKVKIDEELGV